VVDVIGNIISITIVIILIITLILPKKIRYITHSIFLLMFGLVPIFYKLGLLGVTFSDAPQLAYAVLFIIVIAGRTLIVEGIRIEGGIKFFFMTVGILIIIMTTIPVLHQVDALSFGLPKIPPIINEVLYVISGITLIVLTFMIEKD